MTPTHTLTAWRTAAARTVAGIAALLVVGSAAAAGSGAAADYPSRPVEVIVAWAPGGGTDVAARTVLRFAEEVSGEKFVVINRPGASGEIGFTALAHARADGYTIGMINPPTTLMHPIQRPNAVRYRLEDFVPIANIVTDPGVIIVRADSPMRTLADLFEAARRKPVTMAYSGPGTSEALALARMERLKGITFNKIPFDGTAPGLSALLGGHVTAMSTNISEVYSQSEQGLIRILGVGSPKRMAPFSDVATFREQGVDVVQIAMRGFAAPKGFPAAYRDRLVEIFRKAVATDGFEQQAAKLNLPLDFQDPEQFAATLADLDRMLREEWAANPW